MRRIDRIDIAAACLFVLAIAGIFVFQAAQAQPRTVVGPEPNVFQNFTDSDAFDEDVVFAQNAVIVAIKFHADAAPTTNENLVAQEDGTAFKFINRDMVGDADFALLPAAPIPMKRGSTLNITYANTDTAALDIEVVWRYER
jgi:hypothetical protein